MSGNKYYVKQVSGDKYQVELNSLNQSLGSAGQAEFGEAELGQAEFGQNKLLEQIAGLLGASSVWSG